MTSSKLSNFFADPMISLRNPSYGEGASTPEWMIKIDNILESTITGNTKQAPTQDIIEYSQCAELFGWEADIETKTKEHVGGQLHASATIRQSPIVVYLPMGIYAPKLEAKLTRGENIDLIHLVHLSNVTDEKVPLQIISFETCRIDSLKQVINEAHGRKITMLGMVFRAATRWNAYFKYGQDGLFEGQDVSFYDYTMGTSRISG